MTSQQKDNIVRTSCKNCVLAIYDGNTQTGCTADRLNNFEKFEAYDEDKEFYVIERLCNYYRDDRDKYINDENEVELKKIQYESLVSFKLLFDCDEITKENRDKFLQYCVHNASEYDPEKINIKICHGKITREQHQIIKKVINYLNCMALYHSDNTHLNKEVMNSFESFHLVINPKNLNNQDIIVNTNRLINNEMKKLTVVEEDGLFAISNLAYKVTALKNNLKDYNEIIDIVIKESKEMNLYHKV